MSPTRRLVIALAAFAAAAGGHVHSASAEGLERIPVQPQPFELWSKTGSGLGALDPRCDARSAWRFQETVDPWARPAIPCDPARPTVEPGVAPEIVYPWPSRHDEPWAAFHEIVDPWPATRK